MRTLKVWFPHLGLCVALGKAVSPSGPVHRGGARMLAHISPWAAVRIKQKRGSPEPRGVENGEGKAQSGLTPSRVQSEETNVPRGKMTRPSPVALFG